MFFALRFFVQKNAATGGVLLWRRSVCKQAQDSLCPRRSPPGTTEYPVLLLRACSSTRRRTEELLCRKQRTQPLHEGGGLRTGRRTLRIKAASADTADDALLDGPCHRIGCIG